MIAIHGEIQLLDEFNRIEILVAAEAIRHPFSGLAAVVEVDHRGDCVYPQCIDVVRVEPEQCIAGEEVTHFRAPVIEDRAVPLRVVALPRVRMFVQVRAVEIRQAVLVGREVRGHPIQNDANSAAVQVVDEVHEILRRAIARRRSEVPCDLIAPRTVERMLHDGHQLHVRETHFGDVVGHRVSEFAISQ